MCVCVFILRVQEGDRVVDIRGACCMIGRQEQVEKGMKREELIGR